MLDTETKRRIDTARDILVGKVPDPKSQVEQITIALIYKFMDDMDADAEEMGGKRKFLAGKYARYGWSKLMQPGLGGHEMLNLYAEGIQKMPENPGIPPLFREIFKNAFLPYRDPETLKAFLKVIDEFQYDHSERLGDAFEYLLSVLGSQGDAGQFRTPRHIIDFIVDVVDPKKNETVLDPACGTAGFLISSYKHILKANTDAKGHCKLTPDERAKLAANFRGFDISPDMVRLSLVNLYLHGFTDPHIYEYDTLTSLDRWNEHADVILANPPFMSPKGGIKPHNRFGVQSKRSEVLFVDYIAEHLTPNGRAGVIVPEGIIFQSQSAYKQLRKLLVEDYLVAVVSLPAGVFNPYSGVKTSILILDKSLAKRAESIAFFKVENDGFNLGAQRRSIDKDDLPQVRAELHEYLRRLKVRESIDDFKPAQGLVVPKEKVTANGEYNLSGERYRIVAMASRAYPVAMLGDLCPKITDGSHNPPPRADAGKLLLSSQNVFDNRLELGGARFVSDQDFSQEDKRTRVAAGDILLTIVGTIGRCLVVRPEMPRFVLQRSVAVLGCDQEQILPAFLVRVLQSDAMQRTLTKLAKGVAQQGIYLRDLRSLEIPVPPLEVQKGIVAEIEGYQKVIDGARAVLDNYRPYIRIAPDWPTVELGQVVKFINGDRGENYPSAAHRVRAGVPFVNAGHLRDGDVSLTDMDYITRERYELLGSGKFVRGDILYCLRGTLGKCALVQGVECGAIASSLLILRPSDCIVGRFLYFWLTGPQGLELISKNNTGTAQPNLSAANVKKYTIPLPSLGEQQAIVSEIQGEQALVNANRELIARMEKKIQATLARVWSEEPKLMDDKSREAA